MAQDKQTLVDAFKEAAGIQPTYTILINERQRHYIQLALNNFIAEDPGEELDENGDDIPTVLALLFTNEPEQPLSTTGVNSFLV